MIVLQSRASRQMAGPQKAEKSSGFSMSCQKCPATDGTAFNSLKLKDVPLFRLSLLRRKKQLGRCIPSVFGMGRRNPQHEWQCGERRQPRAREWRQVAC